MTTLIAALKEGINEMVTFLRYFAASLVAGSIIWIADADHNVVQPSPLGFPSLEVVGVTVSFWVVLAFLALFGIATYSAHRAVFMPFVGARIHKCLVKGQQPSMEDLSFARWKRRAGPPGSVEKVAQQILDQANATTDFLYCSCWATLIFTSLLLIFFPGALQMGRWQWAGLFGLSVVFGAAGFYSHLNVARLDLVALDKLP